MERIAQENITCKLPYMTGKVPVKSIYYFCIYENLLNDAAKGTYHVIRIAENTEFLTSTIYQN